MNRILGIILIVMGLIFVAWETGHFGNNLMASSNDEIFCDVVATIMVGIGIGLTMKEK